MALALKSRLLLLDEHTAGMKGNLPYHRADPPIAQGSKVIHLLIEHDMRVVFQLADRIMVLAEGAMLAEGTPPEIAANEMVQAAYLRKAA